MIPFVITQVCPGIDYFRVQAEGFRFDILGDKLFCGSVAACKVFFSTFGFSKYVFRGNRWKGGGEGGNPLIM